MGTDKLHLTARAAGFAMACDETVGGPQPRPGQAPVSAQTRAEPAVQRSMALVPSKPSKLALAGWGFGWSVGKTA